MRCAAAACSPKSPSLLRRSGIKSIRTKDEERRSTAQALVIRPDADELRVDATRGGGPRNAIDREQIGCAAHMDLAFLGDSQDILKCVDHHTLELGVDFTLVPEEFLQPLNPLEITD